MQNLNYGAIGNCKSAALISEKGSIDWCCLPDFDSPSVFAKILDTEKGGSFEIIPAGKYEVKQEYMRNTNILSTTFKSGEDAFEVVDFMPRYKISDDDYFTPPEIHRYIRLLSGRPSLRIIYDPKFNYARENVRHIEEENFVISFSTERPTECIYLYSSLKLNDITGGNIIELTGDEFILLAYNQKLINVDIDRVYLEYMRTKVYWLNWTNRSKKYHLYNEYITRSLLVLKIMTYDPTGAVLAAFTTSIPETVGEVRNWDYRFCWLRDASMSIDTLLRMGHYNAAQRYLGFIKGILRTKTDTFQIMYGIRGERELTETELPHLAGFQNSKPVRTGNAAYVQKQNDVFGYMLNVIYQYYKYFPRSLDEIENMWEIVRNIARTVSTHWEKPDRGIWEIRNEEKHFVFSKIMSWVAMERAAKIADLLNKTSYSLSWNDTAADIKNEILTKGWKEDQGTFTQTYCNNYLDASLLLMAEYGFLSYDDEKFGKTVIAVKNALFHKGLMYRYTNEDDFGVPSSSFTICTFWLIQAMYHTGMKEEAETIFKDLISCSNHLKLFSEDIDFDTRMLLGNFPQAYSHLALINTATLFSGEKIISRFIRP